MNNSRNPHRIRCPFPRPYIKNLDNKQKMALIPPVYFNCVVAIGKRKSREKIDWVGTGNLIGRFFKTHSAVKNQYHIFMITNKHVLVDSQALVVRFNPLSSLEDLFRFRYGAASRYRYIRLANGIDRFWLRLCYTFLIITFRGNGVNI